MTKVEIAVIIIAIVFFLLYLILIIFKHCDDRYIKRREVYLDNYHLLKHKLQWNTFSWIAYALIPWRKTVKLKCMEPVSFTLIIKESKAGTYSNCYRIANYERFADSNKFTINDHAINKGNETLWGYERRFKVKVHDYYNDRTEVYVLRGLED